MSGARYFNRKLLSCIGGAFRAHRRIGGDGGKSGLVRLPIGYLNIVRTVGVLSVRGTDALVYPVTRGGTLENAGVIVGALFLCQR